MGILKGQKEKVIKNDTHMLELTRWAGNWHSSSRWW